MSAIESVPQSMYQTDFQRHTIKPRPTSILSKSGQQKPTTERSKHRPIQMDLEILQPFKTDINVPFNLLHKNKSILQTNPHDPIPKVKLEDKLFEQKLEARRRRSAIYMTPQINLDKIPENIMYGKGDSEGGLVGSIYSSDWKKACEVVVSNSPWKLKEDPMKRNFVKKDLLEKSLEQTRFKSESIIPPMDMGLGKNIPTWDRQNPVEFVDTTKLFWEKNKGLGLCSLCDSQNSVKALNDEEKAELQDCLKEDTFRTPFTLHPPGYTGYVPRLADGIQFRKKKFTKYDPFLTTLMASQGAYDKFSI